MDLGVVLGIKTKNVKEKLDELSMRELHLLLLDRASEKFYSAQMEWHRRLAFPVATLILGVFALSLGVQQSHRSGRSYGFIVAILTLIVHFFLISLGESLARRHVVAPVIGLWFPNLFMAFLTAYVSVMTQRGRPLLLAVWLAQGLAILPQRLLRSPTKEPH